MSDAIDNAIKAIQEAQPPSSKWYPLFEHMLDEHGLTLLDDELANIASKVSECRDAATQGVLRAWREQNRADRISKEAMEASEHESHLRLNAYYGSEAHGERVKSPGFFVQQAIDTAIKAMREAQPPADGLAMQPAKSSTKRTIEAIELGIAANKGYPCECDPEVNAAPCRGCAIQQGLVKGLALAFSLALAFIQQAIDAATQDLRRARSLCQTHPTVNYKVDWGCPECVRDLRADNERLRRENDNLRSDCAAWSATKPPWV